MVSTFAIFVLAAGSLAIAKGVITYVLCCKRYSKQVTLLLTAGIPVVTFLLMYLILQLLF
ncbi:TPA: hypothetical protein HA265_03780 [Candidatus Woesearchaeota archaeon]|nr:hypothetical protein [Candidatus Woesearchaeota archaeon]